MLWRFQIFLHWNNNEETKTGTSSALLAVLPISLLKLLPLAVLPAELQTSPLKLLPLVVLPAEQAINNCSKPRFPMNVFSSGTFKNKTDYPFII